MQYGRIHEHRLYLTDKHVSISTSDYEEDCFPSVLAVVNTGTAVVIKGHKDNKICMQR